MKLSKSYFIENFLIKKNAKILIETITRENVELYHKEYQYFTKNILRIKNGRELFDVTQAARIFSKEYENFVYKQLGSNKELNDSYLFSKAKESSWTLILKLEERLSGFVFLDYNSYYMNEKYPKYESIYYKEAWDHIYTLFDKKRKTSYSSVSNMIKSAFKDLYAALDSIQTKEFINRSAKEEFYHNGTKVVIKYDEELDTRNNEVSFFLKALDLSIDRLKFYSLNYILKQVQFILNLTRDRRLDAGGHYESGKVPTIIVNSRMSNIDLYSHTILHELGHYMYDVILNKNIIKEWTTLIESNYFPYTKEIQNEIESIVTSLYDKGDYKDLYNYYLTTVSDSNKYKEEYKYNDMVLQHTLNYLDKNSLAYMVLYNLSNNKYKPTLIPNYIEYEDEQEHRKRFKNSLKFTIESIQELAGSYGRMLKTNITMYAGKNSEEAFCEIFALFISDRWKEHKVSEEVIHFFKTIMSL